MSGQNVKAPMSPTTLTKNGSAMANMVARHTNAERHTSRSALGAKGPTRSSLEMNALSGHAAAARLSTNA